MAYRTDFGSIHQRPLGVFGAPARYVQGPGATWELGRELQRLGFQGPVLFIAGGTAQRILAPIWQEQLPAVGLQPVIDAFGGECSESEIKRLVGMSDHHGFCAVVGASRRFQKTTSENPGKKQAARVHQRGLVHAR